VASIRSTAFDQAERLILDGRLPEARTILVALCEEEPHNADPWLLIAAIDERFGLHQEAMNAYGQARALEPDSPEVGLAEARLLWLEGNWEEAIARARTIAERDPAYAENAAFASRGMRHLGRTREALEAAKRGLESSPGSAALWIERVAAERATGGDVATVIRAALDSDPDNEWLRLQLSNEAGTSNRDLATHLASGPFRHAALSNEASTRLRALRGEPLSCEDGRVLLSSFYDDTADTYDYHYQEVGRALARGVQSLAADFLEGDWRSLRLLDIGCGTGFVTGCLDGAWRQRIGIDISKAMLSRAVLNRRFDDVICGDWNHGIAVLRGGFDVALALDVIGDSDDPRAFIAQCAEILEPGGIVVITRGGDPSWGCERVLPLAVVEDDLDILAVEAGLTVVNHDRVRCAFGPSVIAERKCDVYRKPGIRRTGGTGRRRHDMEPPRRSGLDSLLEASRLTARGDAPKALAILESLREEHGERPEILFRLGFAQQSAGDLQAAKDTYARLIELDPDDPVALFQAGTVHHTLDDPGKAVELYERALKLDASLAIVAFNLSFAAEAQGALARALGSARYAHSLDPGNAAIADRLDHLEKHAAEEVKERCGAPEPGSVEGRVARASGHHRSGNQHRAISLLEPVVPDLLETNSGGIAVLAGAYRKSGRMEDAERVVTEAIAHRPDDPILLESLAGILAGKGELMAALREWERACAHSGPEGGQHSNRLFMYNYSDRFPGGEIARAHRSWGSALESAVEVAVPDFPVDRNPDRRLRLGYVSGDFHTHAVNCFFEPVLKHHDAEEFEVFCYSNTENEDEATQRIRFYTDRWRRIRHLDDDRAAAMIIGDRIDILVDLSGHTGHHRLGIFARKPAPVQATWIGYPNTTGLERIDYRITDHRADPPGDGETDYSEKLLRLPEGFHVFQPPPDSPPTWTDLDPASPGYTFGCCNNIYKVTPDVIRVWSAIMQRIDDSTIVLKSHSFDNDQLYENVWTRFEDNGIDRSRVKLMSAISATDHLSLMRRVEIGLDPFPYNGTTTTCDTLWMGVPVVTLAGDRHAARVGASILGNIGLPDLIARDRDEYISIAVDLAIDDARRKQIRSGLRDRVRCSPLMDYPGFTRSLEREFRRIWRAWCADTKL
jgi:protein O-GlcNAc transferase